MDGWDPDAWDGDAPQGGGRPLLWLALWAGLRSVSLTKLCLTVRNPTWEPHSTFLTSLGEEGAKSLLLAISK